MYVAGYVWLLMYVPVHVLWYICGAQKTTSAMWVPVDIEVRLSDLATSTFIH